MAGDTTKTRPARPPATDLHRFTTALFDPDDIIEVRRLPPGRSTWHRAAELPKLEAKLRRDNDAGQNIYVGANPRKRVGGTKAADVALARSLFADFDNVSPTDAVAKWKGANLPEPTVVLNSGHGCHIYLRLTEPLADLKAWTEWQRDLIAVAGSDPAIHDPPRVMRLPGFANVKDPSRPVVCEIVDADAGRRHELADLHGCIPTRGGAAAVAAPPAPVVGALVSNGRIHAGTRNTHLTSLAGTMRRRGMTVESIEAALLRENRLRCDPPLTTQEVSKLAHSVGRYAPQEPEGNSDSIRPSYVSATNLLAAFPKQREPVIEGLVRRGEVGNIVAAPKMNKSWLLLAMGLSVTQGRPVLDVFPSPRGHVLLLDYELAPGTLAKRLGAVMEAMGLTRSDVDDRLCIQTLRAKALDIDGLTTYFSGISVRQFDLVILDPLYRAFPPEMDENSNVDFARIFGKLQAIVERLDAAMLCVHHMSKGDQSLKSITDLGSGGGSQSRAADCHLGMRAHMEDGAAVVSGVVRSFRPFDAFVMRWEYPLWVPAPDLDPSDLKKPPSRRTKVPDKPVPEAPPTPPYTVDRFVADFLKPERQTKATVLLAANEKGINDHQAGKYLEAALGTGKAFQWKYPKDRRAYYASVSQPALGSVTHTKNKKKKSPRTPRNGTTVPSGAGGVEV